MTTATIETPPTGTPGRVDRDIARAIARLRPAGSWTTQGSCRTADPEIFYASDDTPTAKTVCSRCPVIDRCLAWALESEEPHGVWGGLDEQERKLLLRTKGAVGERLRREALETARMQACAVADTAVIPGRKPAEPAPSPEPPARTIPGLLSQAGHGATQRRAKMDPALAVARAKAAGTPIVVRIAPRLPRPGRRDRRRPLSDREIEVLAGLASGQEREKAAANIGISALTFKSHVARLTAALGSCGSAAHSVGLGYAHGYLQPDPQPRCRRPDIGERALEALCCLAAGRSNLEIAQEMFLVEDTIKTHFRRLMKRFEVGTRAALVDRALHTGLLLAVLDEGEPRS